MYGPGMCVPEGVERSLSLSNQRASISDYLPIPSLSVSLTALELGKFKACNRPSESRWFD